MDGDVIAGAPFWVYQDEYALPILTSPEIIEEFRKLDLRHDDVFIVTYPKSGTHWMQEIVHLIFADGHSDRVTANERRIVVEMVDVKSPDLVPQGVPGFRLMKDSPSPRVFSTHVQCPLLPEQIWKKRCRVIYVYRHPKDVIVSFYNFHLKLYNTFGGIKAVDSPVQFDHFFKTVTSGQIEYGMWMDHVKQYCKYKDEPNFLFVSYEDMKTDLHLIVKKVAKFLNRELDNEAMKRILHGASFSTMKENFRKDSMANEALEKNNVDLNVFLNKGEVSQWKERFTAEQNDTFDKAFKTKMRSCELTKRYVLEEAKL
ncbi:Sulfotransferase family cytosolic 1B member 1 [Holothuria leucospilota]|uniref:Sulfotransferase family cytosolic 1B member 1 n=1 Tax=Holothuria leucospilota TaxID=206669 RepID=A0A9Q0YMW6_HOLLE|nr:Sulfotransferase family cytosolic 1B member 1 [Holothuria leucospilota]